MALHELAAGGRTGWRIVMAHPAHETVRLAADELHRFLQEMSGASLPVQTELSADGEREILVGPSGRMARWGVREDFHGLGEEGFVLRSGPGWLLLAGATPRATLYAVYAFLEELGCRWFSSDCSVIPRRTTLTFPDLDRRERPAFESREAYWRDAFDGDFAVRSRMNSNKADISVRQGGRMKFFNFHHSFNDLVPPERYFAAHPEYYSLVDGKRLGERTQLCLTNPEVQRIALETLETWIAENPDCRVFSVAQNDWAHFCTCPRCAAVDAEEESHAGTVIRFVNALAEAVEKKHPRVLLHTFAYQYTRKAPRFVRPRDNVIVRLCSIECCFTHPLDGTLPGPLAPGAEAEPHPQCAARGETDFLRDLRAWSRICPRLYVWDYVTQFRNYLSPMPNFDVLARNLRLFRDLGVKGVLEQGNFSHGGGGYLAELEAYLQARLMWNPDCDMERHMTEFLQGYYGPDAAPLVRRSIDAWQAAARGWHVGIYYDCRAPFVTDALIERTEALLGEALFLTGDERQRRRIEKLRLGMTYLVLARMPAQTPGRGALIARFFWQLREAGVSELHERWTLEEALDQLRETDDARRWKRTVVNDYKM